MYNTLAQTSPRQNQIRPEQAYGASMGMPGQKPRQAVRAQQSAQFNQIPPNFSKCKLLCMLFSLILMTCTSITVLVILGIQKSSGFFQSTSLSGFTQTSSCTLYLVNKYSTNYYDLRLKVASLSLAVGGVLVIVLIVLVIVKRRNQMCCGTSNNNQTNHMKSSWAIYTSKQKTKDNQKKDGSQCKKQKTNKEQPLLEKPQNCVQNKDLLSSDQDYVPFSPLFVLIHSLIIIFCSIPLGHHLSFIIQFQNCDYSISFMYLLVFCILQAIYFTVLKEIKQKQQIRKQQEIIKSEQKIRRLEQENKMNQAKQTKVNEKTINRRTPKGKPIPSNKMDTNQNKLATIPQETSNMISQSPSQNSVNNSKIAIPNNSSPNQEINNVNHSNTNGVHNALQNRNNLANKYGKMSSNVGDVQQPSTGNNNCAVTSSYGLDGSSNTSGSNGPVLSGNGPALSGSGPALSGNDLVLSGNDLVLSGSGSALSGSGPVLSGSGPVLSGSGPVLSGSGPVLSSNTTSINNCVNNPGTTLLSTELPSSNISGPVINQIPDNYNHKVQNNTNQQQQLKPINNRQQKQANIMSGDKVNSNNFKNESDQRIESNIYNNEPYIDYIDNKPCINSEPNIKDSQPNIKDSQPNINNSIPNNNDNEPNPNNKWPGNDQKQPQHIKSDQQSNFQITQQQNQPSHGPYLNDYNNNKINGYKQQQIQMTHMNRNNLNRPQKLAYTLQSEQPTHHKLSIPNPYHNLNPILNNKSSNEVMSASKQPVALNPQLPYQQPAINPPQRKKLSHCSSIYNIYQSSPHSAMTSNVSLVNQRSVNPIFKGNDPEKNANPREHRQQQEQNRSNSANTSPQARFQTNIKQAYQNQLDRQFTQPNIQRFQPFNQKVTIMPQMISEENYFRAIDKSKVVRVVGSNQLNHSNDGDFTGDKRSSRIRGDNNSNQIQVQQYQRNFNSHYSDYRYNNNTTHNNSYPATSRTVPLKQQVYGIWAYNQPIPAQSRRQIRQNINNNSISSEQQRNHHSGSSYFHRQIKKQINNSSNKIRDNDNYNTSSSGGKYSHQFFIQLNKNPNHQSKSKDQGVNLQQIKQSYQNQKKRGKNSKKRIGQTIVQNQQKQLDNRVVQETIKFMSQNNYQSVLNPVIKENKLLKDKQLQSMQQDQVRRDNQIQRDTKTPKLKKKIEKSKEQLSKDEKLITTQTFTKAQPETNGLKYPKNRNIQQYSSQSQSQLSNDNQIYEKQQKSPQLLKRQKQLISQNKYKEKILRKRRNSDNADEYQPVFIRPLITSSPSNSAQRKNIYSSKQKRKYLQESYKAQYILLTSKKREKVQQNK